MKLIDDSCHLSDKRKLFQGDVTIQFIQLKIF